MISTNRSRDDVAESKAAVERAFMATQVCVEVDHAMAAGLCPTISIPVMGQSVARLPFGIGFYRERAGGLQHVYTVVSHPSNIAP